MLWGNLVINPSNILPPNYTLPNFSNSTSTNNNSKTENSYKNPMYPSGKYIIHKNISMGYENNETNYPDEAESSYLYSYNKGNKSSSKSNEHKG